ncbi:MAG: AAA family ATPase [Planctomycetales bacterium]|nr:AAA family ATPase [Planctomycetales bacterium]
MAQSLLEFLGNPSSYPEHPKRVEVRQTHTSWVFLTDTRAYKLKKPVKFDFLDFSTVDQRRKACADELRLNQRLAPDVYQDVTPIYLDAKGRYSLRKKGQIADWLVKMRRLDDARSLQSQIETDTVSATEIARLASRLTQFYGDAPPVSLQPSEYRFALDCHIRANRTVLLDHVRDRQGDVVRRVHTAQLLYLHAKACVFDERVCDGRIVEGHGDLRPEHIYLLSTPTIIDCIEFSREFRELDVVDELAFLAMECSRAHAAWIGKQILQAYVDASGDRVPEELLAFYATYRACVRAKVALLRGDQMAEGPGPVAHDEAVEYLQLADEQATRFGQAVVFVVRGLTGTGKTTTAKALAERFGLHHLQTDLVRRQMFPANSGETPAYGEGRYAPENRQHVYEELLRRAEVLLARGLSVVLDGTFATSQLHERVMEVAERFHAKPLFINCTCEAELATGRIEQRRLLGDALSEATPSTHARQCRAEQLPRASIPQCSIDTSCAISLIERTVASAISRCRATATGV